MVVENEAAAWDRRRQAEFAAWTPARPGLQQQLQRLIDKTAAQAAARAIARAGRWDEICAAAAQRSSRIGEPERAEGADLAAQAARLVRDGDRAGAIRA